MRARQRERFAALRWERPSAAFAGSTAGQVSAYFRAPSEASSTI